MLKSLKSLFGRDPKPLGTWSDGSSATTVEIAGIAGFDFIIIDNEHGCHKNPNWLELVRTAEACNILPIIRVPGANYEDLIKKSLDMGAAGILVPNINCKEDAETAVRYSKYAPIGKRGACPYVRANCYEYKYGTVDYYQKANEEVTVIALIESTEAVKNFDEIISVEGIDAVLFGRVDLSVSMGIPGELYHEKLVGSLSEMIAKAKAKGMPCGMVGFGTEDTRQWYRSDIDFVTNGVDTNFMLARYKEEFSAICG